MDDGVVPSGYSDQREGKEEGKERGRIITSLFKDLIGLISSDH